MIRSTISHYSKLKIEICIRSWTCSRGFKFKVIFALNGCHIYWILIMIFGQWNECITTSIIITIIMITITIFITITIITITITITISLITICITITIITSTSTNALITTVIITIITIITITIIMVVIFKSPSQLPS